MSRLRANVHVQDEAGRFHVFTPRDTVPEWAREKIKNPHAWVDEPVEEQVVKPAPSLQQTVFNLDDAGVAELREYAAKQNPAIDLTGKTRKADIRERIRAVEAGEEPAEPNLPDTGSDGSDKSDDTKSDDEE